MHDHHSLAQPGIPHVYGMQACLRSIHHTIKLATCLITSFEHCIFHRETGIVEVRALYFRKYTHLNQLQLNHLTIGLHAPLYDIKAILSLTLCGQVWHLLTTEW